MDMANWGHTLLGDPIIGFVGGMQRNRLEPLNDRIHAGTLVTARVFNTSEQTLGTVGTALLFCEVGCVIVYGNWVQLECFLFPVRR